MPMYRVLRSKWRLFMGDIEKRWEAAAAAEIRVRCDDRAMAAALRIWKRPNALQQKQTSGKLWPASVEALPEEPLLYT